MRGTGPDAAGAAAGTEDEEDAMTKATVKPPREYRARIKGFRQSASKARLVVDLVRGRNVAEALNILKFTHNRAARPIEESIRSAMANAVQVSNKENLGLDENALLISEARVDQGMSFSRFRPRSRGMAAPYKRYFCHFEVRLVRAEDAEKLKLYRQVRSQKKRVDRIADMKGLEVIGA
jgi:large subunit ribosomal protein L22